MRIGLDAKRAFFNSRGLGNYSRGLITSLSKYYPEEDFLLYSPENKKPIAFERGENCTLHHPTHFPWTSFPALWRSYGCVSDLKKEGVELYHGLSHELPIGIEKTDIKTVVTMHDVIFLKHPEWFPLFDRYMFKKKYVDSCKRADVVVAISELTKNDIVETIGVDASKIKVVYQGCNAVFQNVCSSEEKEAVRQRYGLPTDFLITVCAIEERKNHKCIIKALTQMKNDIHYVIVGRESKFKQELVIYANELGVANRVLFLHDIPTTTLPALLQMAKAFVFPSFYEGFGIPIIESQTSSLPTIISRASCFSEVGREGSLYADPNNSEEWATVIDNLLEHESLQHELIAKGKENIKRFSDSQIADDMMSVYKLTRQL